MRNSPVPTALRAWIAAIAFGIVAPQVVLGAALPDAPKPTESFDVGTLHVDRYGSGKRAVILIPGLGCGPWVWNATIAKLAPSDTVYAVTLPGFDGRPAVTNERSLFAAFTRDLQALVDTRKLDRPAIVGHSLGGTLAFAYGEQHPTVPSAIVAVDGLPIFPLLAFSPPEARVKAADGAAQMYAGISHADEEKMAERYMATIGTNDPTLVAPTAALQAKSDPSAVAAWLHEDLVTDLRPDLAKITAPVLEIVPYNAPDRTTPPTNYTQAQTVEFYTGILAGTPKLTVTPLPAARHFAMLDQPAKFGDVLASFLDETARSAEASK